MVARRLRLIVADDDADTCELVRTALRSIASEIRVVADGAALLRETRDNGPFDVIITDIQMPVMGGLEAIDAIRALGIETPVVVMTGRPEVGVPPSLDNVTLIRKPFGVAELRSAVAQYR
jgi:two-component system, cell cycle response regulator CpdR